MTPGPLTRSQTRPRAGLRLLVATLLLTQLAGPLVHLACLGGPADHRGALADPLASALGFDPVAPSEDGHHAEDCLLCRSLQGRDRVLIENTALHAPEIEEGSAELLTSISSPDRDLLVSVPPRAPPVSA